MVEQFQRVALAGVGLNAAALPVMAVLLGMAIPTVIRAVFRAAWPANAVSSFLRLLSGLPHLPGWLSYRAARVPADTLEVTALDCHWRGYG